MDRVSPNKTLGTKMATVFFDTSAINFLVDKKISGKEVAQFFKQKNRIPVVGRNTVYECAHTYLTSNVEKADRLITFLEELDPDYTLTRHELYLIEIEKLHTDALYSYFCSELDKKISRLVMNT